MNSPDQSLQKALSDALAHWHGAGVTLLPKADSDHVETLIDRFHKLQEKSAISPRDSASPQQSPATRTPESPRDASQTRPSAGVSERPVPVRTESTGGGLFGPRRRQPEIPSSSHPPADPQHSPLQSDSSMPVSPPNLSASKLNKAERQAELDSLAQVVSQCTRCPQLVAERTQTVFGVGNPKAKVMFIGEAPGADEDKQGEPFVGRAGKLLDKIIAACGWKREEIYICNILRCRPPGNRNPTTDEAANCREYLDGQIRLVDPQYIVCWGTIAAQNVLGEQQPIGRLRGKLFQFGRAQVLCTYHPSYLLRNPSAKKHVWEDLKILLRELGIDPETLNQES